jgi:hypothetical protein
MTLPYRTEETGVRTDILIAVEDPGAANFVLDLPPGLRKRGLAMTLVGFGHSPRFLRDRGVECLEPGREATYDQIIDSVRPHLVLVGTSQNAESPVLALLESAKSRGIPVVGFVDMAVDADRRFRGISLNPLRHAPDWLLVPDQPTRQAFLALGFDGSRILRCGHPAYDRVIRRATELGEKDRRAMRVQAFGADPAPRQVWMFAAEHGDDDSRLRAGPDYLLHGRGSSARRVDIVLEEVLEARAKLLPSPFLILRLHPKNTADEFRSYLAEVDLVSQNEDPLTLVWLSDLIIGLSSMLMMEAALMGRRTLAVVPRECEREWSPSVVEGVTPCVTTRAALWQALTNQVEAVPPRIPLGAIDSICMVLDELLAGNLSPERQPRARPRLATWQ